jgi:predicted acetyltransferase
MWHYSCMLDIRLELFSEQTRPIVENLWQLYRHDLSEFRSTMPSTNGKFPLKRLPSFFDDPDRAGYLIYDHEELAGFALVRGIVKPPLEMSEFFILRALRRSKIGFNAAKLIIETRPGIWGIPFQQENPGAARFWKNLAQACAPNNWVEESRPVTGKPEIPPDIWILFSIKK